MSLFDSITHAASGVGDFVGGAVHAGQDMIGGGLHAAGDLAGGAMHAGQDMIGGAMHAGGHLADGAMHAGSDLMHGDIGGAVGHMAGGIGGAAGDLAHGQMDAMGHMGGGIMHAGQDLAGGAMHAAGDLAHGAGSLVGGAWPLIKNGLAVKSGISMAKEGVPSIFKLRGQVTGGWDAAAKGIGGLNGLLGFGSSSKKEEDKDGVDKGLDTGKSVLGAVKTAVQAPAQIALFAEQAGKGILPAAGLLEKVTGQSASVLGPALAKKMGPLTGLIEKGGTKLLEGPLGKSLTGVVAHQAGGGLGKLAAKVVPGLNIAMAGISAFSSGKDAYERWQKGDKMGAAIEGLHTITNLAGAIPGVGGAISAGGDLVAGAAHWLADGGAKKLGGMVSGAAGAVGSAVGSAAKAVSGAIGGVSNVAGKVAGAVGSTVSNVAGKVGGAVGGAAKAVGGAIGGAAKKIFSGW